MTNSRAMTQIVWGVLLALAGVGVFYRIPQVMSRLQDVGRFSSESVSIRFCFYLLGTLLIGGGVRKIYLHAKALRKSPPEPPSDDR